MPETLRTVRTALANLYWDKVSATRIAEDAGLPISIFALSDRAIDNWHAILTEAQKRQRLEALLQVASAEYSDNAELAAALRGMR